MGKRGYGVNPTMIGYEARSFAEIIEHQNRNTLAVVQFETVSAMERADELLSLPGLDVIMVGPADLSISLGIPGQFENPLLISTVDRLIEKCNRARRGAGHPDAQRGDGEVLGRARHALRGRGGGARAAAGEGARKRWGSCGLRGRRRKCRAPKLIRQSFALRDVLFQLFAIGEVSGLRPAPAE